MPDKEASAGTNAGFKTPDQQTLAEMNHDEIAKLAKKLPSSRDRLALLNWWSVNRSNRHHGGKIQALDQRQRRLEKCTASKEELARLRRDAMYVCADLHQSITHNAQVLNHYARASQAQASTLRQHGSRLDTHQQAIITLGQEGRKLHRQAMNEIGGVVHAMCENGSQIEDERRNANVRFDYLVRAAAALRERQQEEALAREGAESRVRELEGQVIQLKTEHERANRLMLELPEMRLTRSLVLTAQSLKAGLANVLRFRLVQAGAAVLLLAIMSAAAVSQSEIRQAQAQSQPAISAQTHMNCAYWDAASGEISVVPADAVFHEKQWYNVINCGTTDEVRLFLTHREQLPKDGIFAKTQVVKLPE